MIIVRIVLLIKCQFRNACILNHGNHGTIITIVLADPCIGITESSQFNHNPDTSISFNTHCHKLRSISALFTSISLFTLRQCQDSIQRYHHTFVLSTFICHLTGSHRKPLRDKTSCWHCIGGKPFRIETSF